MARVPSHHCEGERHLERCTRLAAFSLGQASPVVPLVQSVPAESSRQEYGVRCLLLLQGPPDPAESPSPALQRQNSSCWSHRQVQHNRYVMSGRHSLFQVHSHLDEARQERCSSPRWQRTQLWAEVHLSAPGAVPSPDEGGSRCGLGEAGFCPGSVRVL